MAVCWSMKKFVAFILALGSGLYLLTIGVMPDPLPLVDEAVAFLIFLNSTAYLGFDLRRFVGLKSKVQAAESRTVDV